MEAIKSDHSLRRKVHIHPITQYSEYSNIFTAIYTTITFFKTFLSLSVYV